MHPRRIETAELRHRTCALHPAPEANQCPCPTAPLKAASNLVSAAASRSTTPRSCWACRAGPSTTGSATAGCRPSARWAGRSACRSNRCMDLGGAPAREPSSGREPARDRAAAPSPRRSSRCSCWPRRIQPAMAQRRARLSADLADHLAAGSQTIDVIVHGDAAEVDALAREYNLRVKKSLRSGAVVRLNASQLDGAAERRGGRSSVRATSGSSRSARRHRGDHRRRPGVGRRGRPQAADGQGHHRRGDRFGHRHAGTSALGEPRDRDRGLHRRRRPRTATATGRTWRRSSRGRPGGTADTADYRGIAYGAYLVNLRVLGDDGSGTASDVIEAIDWAIEHRKRYNIRRHQPVARRAGAAAVPRRSAVRGGGAGDAGGDSGRGGGGQLRAERRTGCRSSG